MYGEHASVPDVEEIREGSSPHVRGAPAVGHLAAQRIGIIPACTGSTLEFAVVNFLLGDHPRMYGEHWNPISSIAPDVGSSPHVRGALDVELKRNDVDGIIPACTGSTTSDIPAPSSIGDHPRMYGEHRVVRSSCTA